MAGDAGNVSVEVTVTCGVGVGGGLDEINISRDESTWGENLLYVPLGHEESAACVIRGYDNGAVYDIHAVDRLPEICLHQNPLALWPGVFVMPPSRLQNSCSGPVFLDANRPFCNTFASNHLRFGYKSLIQQTIGDDMIILTIKKCV